MFSKFISIKNKKFIDELLKFGFVGILNTVVGTLIMFVFYNIIEANYWVSSASNYIIGSLLSYVLNKRFTFKVTAKSPLFALKFVINISWCYLFSYGLARKMVCYYIEYMNLNQKIMDNISMLMGMGIFIILNFVGQKYFVFGNKEADK